MVTGATHGVTDSVTQDVVSYNAKIIRGSGWAEGLELCPRKRSPLHVRGRKGRSRKGAVSADYVKRFRSRGLLVDWLRRARKGEHKGKVSKVVRRYRCGGVLQARLDYQRKRWEENRKRACRRARTTLRRKAKELWAKSGGELYMLTLTYDEKSYVEDYDSVYGDVRQFFRRVRRKVGRSIGYIAVPERGEKGGRWHWHLVVDVYLDWKVWEKLWGCGYIWVEKVRNLSHCVRYLMKYLSKTFSDSAVPEGKHRYLSSRGLGSWSVQYVVTRMEYETWFRFRQKNEGYEVVGMYSSEEEGCRWWEAVCGEVSGSTSSSLDLTDEFGPKRGCGEVDSVLKWSREVGRDEER